MPDPAKRRIPAKRITVSSLLAIVLLTIFCMNGSSEVYVGQRVKASVPFERIDHSDWNRLLQKYVDRDGQVNYRDWHQNGADRDALNRYLNTLSTGIATQSPAAEARLAFWINAYNAVTIHGILREYPTSSIRNHTARVLGYKIWDDLQLYVGGKPYSLNSMEHKILRKMNEPRIHFAIVCASVSCPRLLNEAYVPDRINEQLETNARDFFAREQNFRYVRGRMQLSSILNWFGSDFGGNQKEQLNAIAKWLPDESQKAAQSARVKVSYLDYDWELNEQQ